MTYQVEAVENGIIVYRAFVDAHDAAEAVESGKMHAGCTVSDEAQWRAFSAE